MPLLPPLVLEVGSDPQVPTFYNSTYLDPQVDLTGNLGAHHYLLGNKFVFYVDHMALVYLVNKR